MTFTMRFHFYNKDKDKIIHPLQTNMEPVESLVYIGIIIRENKSKLYCKALIYSYIRYMYKLFPIF